MNQGAGIILRWLMSMWELAECSMYNIAGTLNNLYPGILGHLGKEYY